MKYVSKYIVSEKNSFEAYVCRLVITTSPPGSSSAETQKWKNSDKMGISVGLPIPLVIAPTIAPEDDKPSSHGVHKDLSKEHVNILVNDFRAPKILYRCSL